MTSQPGKHNCNTYITQYLKSKGNHTMKLGQLIETFFLKNHAQNVVEKLFTDPFLKNQN